MGHSRSTQSKEEESLWLGHTLTHTQTHTHTHIHMETVRITSQGITLQISLEKYGYKIDKNSPSLELCLTKFSLLLRAGRRTYSAVSKCKASRNTFLSSPWLTFSLAFVVWIYSDGLTRCADSIKRWGFTLSFQTA